MPRARTAQASLKSRPMGPDTPLPSPGHSGPAGRCRRTLAPFVSPREAPPQETCSASHPGWGGQVLLAAAKGVTLYTPLSSTSGQCQHFRQGRSCTSTADTSEKASSVATGLILGQGGVPVWHVPRPAHPTHCPDPPGSEKHLHGNNWPLGETEVRAGTRLTVWGRGSSRSPTPQVGARFWPYRAAGPTG